MTYAYSELAGGATPTSTQLDFTASFVRVRYIAGSVTCSIGFDNTGGTDVFVKLDPLSSGLQQTHPHEIQLPIPNGISKIWNQTNATTIAITAWT